MNGPTQYPRRNKVVVNAAMTSETPKSSEMEVRDPEGSADAKLPFSTRKEAQHVMYHFRPVDQLAK